MPLSGATVADALAASSPPIHVSAALPTPQERPSVVLKGCQNALDVINLHFAPSSYTHIISLPADAHSAQLVAAVANMGHKNIATCEVADSALLVCPTETDLNNSQILLCCCWISDSNIDQLLCLIDHMNNGLCSTTLTGILSIDCDTKLVESKHEKLHKHRLVRLSQHIPGVNVINNSDHMLEHNSLSIVSQMTSLIADNSGSVTEIASGAKEIDVPAVNNDSVAATTNSTNPSEDRAAAYHRPLVYISQLESNSPGEDRFNLQCSHSTAGESSYRAFAVIDGHGGFLAADLASEYLLDYIINDLAAANLIYNPEPNRIISVINRAFERLDALILETAITRIQQLSQHYNNQQSQEYLRHREQFMRPGCCAVVALIIGGEMYIANVGDCRAVLFSKREVVVSTPVRQQVSHAEAPPVPSLCRSLSLTLPSHAAMHNGCLDVSTYHRESPFTVYDRVVDALHAEPTECKTESSVSSNCSDLFIDQIFKPLINYYSYRQHKSYLSGGSYAGPHITPANFQDIGGEYFHCTKSSYNVSGITLDHSCLVAEEREAISKKTKDPMPLRPSIQGRRVHGRFAPDRVAGSLAVTRALGDGYLKRKELCPCGAEEFVPYIASVPTVYHKRVDEADIAIVLASDGLWNFVNARECLDILTDCRGLLRPQGSADVKFIEDYRSQLHSDLISGWHCDSSKISLRSHYPKGVNNAGAAAVASMDTVQKAKDGDQIQQGDPGLTASIAAETILPIPTNCPTTAVEPPINILLEGYAPHSTKTFTDLAKSSIAQFENFSQIQQRKRTFGAMAELTSQAVFSPGGSRLAAAANVTPRRNNEGLQYSPSAALLHQCLVNAAASARLDLNTFASLTAGSQRRSLCDDVTVMVIPICDVMNTSDRNLLQATSLAMDIQDADVKLA